MAENETVHVTIKAAIIPEFRNSDIMGLKQNMGKMSDAEEDRLRRRATTGPIYPDERERLLSRASGGGIYGKHQAVRGSFYDENIRVGGAVHNIAEVLANKDKYTGVRKNIPLYAQATHDEQEAAYRAAQKTNAAIKAEGIAAKASKISQGATDFYYTGRQSNADAVAAGKIFRLMEKEEGLRKQIVSNLEKTAKDLEKQSNKIYADIFANPNSAGSEGAKEEGDRLRAKAKRIRDMIPDGPGGPGGPGGGLDDEGGGSRAIQLLTNLGGSRLGGVGKYIGGMGPGGQVALMTTGMIIALAAARTKIVHKSVLGQNFIGQIGDIERGLGTSEPLFKQYLGGQHSLNDPEQWGRMSAQDRMKFIDTLGKSGRFGGQGTLGRGLVSASKTFAEFGVGRGFAPEQTAEFAASQFRALGPSFRAKGDTAGFATESVKELRKYFDTSLKYQVSQADSMESLKSIQESFVSQGMLLDQSSISDLARTLVAWNSTMNPGLQGEQGAKLLGGLLNPGEGLFPFEAQYVGNMSPEEQRKHLKGALSREPNKRDEEQYIGHTYQLTKLLTSLPRTQEYAEGLYNSPAMKKLQQGPNADFMASLFTGMPLAGTARLGPFGDAITARGKYSEGGSNDPAETSVLAKERSQSINSMAELSKSLNYAGPIFQFLADTVNATAIGIRKMAPMQRDYVGAGHKNDWLNWGRYNPVDRKPFRHGGTPSTTSDDGYQADGWTDAEFFQWLGSVGSRGKKGSPGGSPGGPGSFSSGSKAKFSLSGAGASNLLARIDVESSGKQSAVSNKGARGLLQLTKIAYMELQRLGFAPKDKSYESLSYSELAAHGYRYLQITKSHQGANTPGDADAKYVQGPDATENSSVPETREYVGNMARKTSMYADMLKGTEGTGSSTFSIGDINVTINDQNPDKAEELAALLRKHLPGIVVAGTQAVMDRTRAKKDGSPMQPGPTSGSNPVGMGQQ